MKHSGKKEWIKGRPRNNIRKAWQLRYGLTDEQKRTITDYVCAQLSYCKSDEARRLILGVK